MKGAVYIMQLLIMSDTHGDKSIISKVKAYYPNADLYIHCGDSELTYGDKALTDFYYVRGNCDWDKKFAEEQILTVDDKVIFVTHGHKLNVKSTLMPLSYRAQEVNANIVCFGHSHLLGVEMIGNTLYLNPGSLTAPRGRNEKSFMVVELDGNDVIVNCFDDNNDLIEKATFTF